MGDGTLPPLQFWRNLPAAPYRQLIAGLAAEARRNKARRLDFVLAGDIFDLHRTGLWFRDNPADVRPYVDNTAVSPAQEAFLLRVIDGIANEVHAVDVLAVLRLLAAGRYVDEAGQERLFPVPVEVHYIPGNHDRFANATPAIRTAVRQALGLPGHGAAFPQSLHMENEKALVRHGHEYDFVNFSVDHRQTETFPIHLPLEQYQGAAFGDFATVDLASRLPTLFRETHGDQAILADQTLRTLYLRLLEFDDLRPLTAVFNYFIYADGQIIDSDVAWRAIEPVLITLLEEIADDPFLASWLEKLDQPWRLDIIDAVQAALATRPWRWLPPRLPFDLAERVAARALAGTTARPGAERFAAHESSIKNGQNRYIIAGHTHRPQVALIANDRQGERYYVDTGTWRNRVPSTPDFKQFGRLKTLNYMIAYGPDEDRGALPADGVKIASFDYWSGYAQGWERDRQGIRPLDKTR
jgi:UDP-2,3-diacylglucosamine pyrophosphatase LpxH